MEKEKTISISKGMAAQILDCLERRIQDWDDTVKVLRDEPPSSSFFIPEECSGSEEAERIANSLREIYDELSQKMLADLA